MIETKIKVETELARGEQISIVNLVDLLVEHACAVNASDIHIDPTHNSLRVRFRVDGILFDAHHFPKKLHSEIITRIKVLARLRTDEHQATQDGRFRTRFGGQYPIDVRVSIVPTYYGENAMLRLLSEQAKEFTLESLGFTKSNQEKVLRAMRKPYGMILATGPTGSGKTTTLYTVLKTLNTKEVSIITIEDPIEYAIDGINQIQINPRTGLTFANGLRSVLRQDPNVIMVGEIRDLETASLAVNTALTGHLLLSTLHTNDAATTLPRLLDMKIEPYLIASTVNVAIGQRLVRKICPDCKVKKNISREERESLAEIFSWAILGKKPIFYEGSGCSPCNQTGYSGRIGVQEVLVVDGFLREAALRKAPASEINRISKRAGMTTMVEDAITKARSGLTTIEEVLRILHE